MRYELVVARYNENLNWLRRVPREFRITLYDKSTSPHPDSIVLPNIGREAHTYLHHIVSRYDSLSPQTVFCQGHPFDHAFDFHQTLRAVSAGETRGEHFHWLGHFADTDSPDGKLFRAWSKNDTGEGLDLNDFHRALFDEDGPEEYSFFGGAQFVVTRERIHSRAREWYENGLRISIEFPQAAHCFERMWDRIFGAQENTRERMNGEKTKYFKPIRRLTL